MLYKVYREYFSYGQRLKYFTIALKNMQASGGKTKPYVKDNQITARIIKPLFHVTVQRAMEMIIVSVLTEGLVSLPGWQIQGTTQDRSCKQFKS